MPSSLPCEFNLREQSYHTALVPRITHGPRLVDTQAKLSRVSCRTVLEDCCVVREPGNVHSSLMIEC